jgi:hypothetical protein
MNFYFLMIILFIYIYIYIYIFFFSGFLRSDVLIGTASVKLLNLLNHCQIHEAADVSIRLLLSSKMVTFNDCVL